MSQHCAEIDCPLFKRTRLVLTSSKVAVVTKNKKNIKNSMPYDWYIYINMDQKSALVYHTGYCLTLGIYGYKTPKLQTCLESKQCMNSV